MSKVAEYKMFRDIEQDEDVTRGNVKVIEIIAYDAAGKKQDADGNVKVVEKSRGPYFCQDGEDAVTFRENNPNARIETFTIQLLKSTAVKNIDSPDNIKQFVKKEAANA